MDKDKIKITVEGYQKDENKWEKHEIICDVAAVVHMENEVGDMAIASQNENMSPRNIALLEKIFEISIDAYFDAVKDEFITSQNINSDDLPDPDGYDNFEDFLCDVMEEGPLGGLL